MSDADRAQKIEEYEEEERRTHGYHQELDQDRNGVPDYQEQDERDAEEDRQRRLVDKNHNGIPDHLESNPANDDHAVFDREVHRNSPLDRETRYVAGVVAASQEVGEASPDMKNRVREAGALMSQEIQKDESNPKKGEFGKGALAARMSKLRQKRIPKSTLIGDLSRLPPAKADPDNGFEMVKASWRGILHAMRSSQQDSKSKRDAKLDQEIQDLRDAQRELDQAEKRLEKDDASGKGAALNAAKDEAAEVAKSNDRSKSGPDPETGNDGGSSGGPAGQPIAAPEQSKTSDIKETEGPEVSGGKTVGDGGLGMAVAAANPALGVAMTAVQANETQKEAGQSFGQNGSTPAAKAPEANSQPGETVHAKSEAISGQRTLALAPDAKDPGHRRSDGAPAPTIIKASERNGPLHEQARALKRPDKQVLSKGPTNPAPRPRALGLGSGIAIFTKAIRAMAPRDESLDVQRFMQNQRDSEGRGR